MCFSAYAVATRSCEEASTNASIISDDTKTETAAGVDGTLARVVNAKKSMKASEEETDTDTTPLTPKDFGAPGRIEERVKASHFKYSKAAADANAVPKQRIATERIILIAE